MVDGILVSVTVISLAIASVMGVITWRVLRQERRRSDVRVAELESAAAEPESAAAEPDLGDLADLGGQPPAEEVWISARGPAAPELFEDAEPMTGNGRRLMLAVGLGSAALLVAFTAVLALNPPPSPRATISPAAARVSAPLELVALDHARTGVRLSIRGLVRNPAAGSAIRHLVAVVFLFDRNGGYLGMTQAPVFEQNLPPGSEAAFDIPVESGQQVARYRLSFRAESAPVPHVDRRSPAPGTAPVTRRAAVAQQASLSGAPSGAR